MGLQNGPIEHRKGFIIQSYDGGVERKNTELEWSVIVHKL